MQSVFAVQFAAQEPPFVVTHVSPRQQSVSAWHALPACMQRLGQKPIGEQ
jgi:hypothetical protein